MSTPAGPELNILALLVFSCVMVEAVRSTSMDFQHIMFLWFGGSLLLTLFFNVTRILVMQKVISTLYTESNLYFLNILYYSLLNFSIYCWVLYSESFTDGHGLDKRRNRLHLFWPFGLIILANVTTKWTHLIFYIGYMETVTRMDYFYIEVAVVISVLVGESLRRFMYMPLEPDPVREQQEKIAAEFPVIVIPLTLLGLISNTEPIGAASMAFAAVYTYFGMQMQAESIDPLTKINNRLRMKIVLPEMIRDHDKQLWLLMMDVDYFKSINDTYGHVEGDRALQRVAQGLKESCRSTLKDYFLGRFGGDEFTIILAGDHEDVERLKKAIRKTLRVLNRYEEAPYDLTISIGAACYEDLPENQMHPENLFKKADEALYAVKKARTLPRNAVPSKEPVTLKTEADKS